MARPVTIERRPNEGAVSLLAQFLPLLAVTPKQAFALCVAEETMVEKYREVQKFLSKTAIPPMSHDYYDVPVELPGTIRTMDKLSFAEWLGLDPPGKTADTGAMEYLNRDAAEIFEGDDTKRGVRLPPYIDKQNWQLGASPSVNACSGLAMKVLQAEARVMNYKSFEPLFQNITEENIVDPRKSFLPRRVFQILGTETMGGGSLYEDDCWFKDYMPEVDSMGLSVLNGTTWEALTAAGTIGQALYANTRGLRRHQMLKKAAETSFRHYGIADEFRTIRDQVQAGGPSSAEVQKVVDLFTRADLLGPLSPQELQTFSSTVTAALTPANQKTVKELVKKQFETSGSGENTGQYTNLQTSLEFVFDTRRTAFLEQVARDLRRKLSLPIEEGTQCRQVPTNLWAKGNQASEDLMSTHLKAAWNKLNNVVIFSAFKSYLKDSYFPKLFDKEIKYNMYGPESLTKWAGALNLDAQATLAVGDQLLRMDSNVGFGLFYWVFGAPHRLTPHIHPLTCVHRSALPGADVPVAKILWDTPKSVKFDKWGIVTDWTLYEVRNQEKKSTMRRVADRPIAHVYLNRDARSDDNAFQELRPTPAFLHDILAAIVSKRTAAPEQVLRNTLKKISSLRHGNDYNKLALSLDLNCYLLANYDFDFAIPVSFKPTTD